MFITKKVFDPALKGKAIKLTGPAIAGNFIITEVSNNALHVIGVSVRVRSFSALDFESGTYAMDMLEAPKQEVEAQPEDPDKGKHQPGFTRNVGTRKIRSSRQMYEDNNRVERILKESGIPMQLSMVLKRMHEMGHMHWNTNNASSFVKHAIDSGRKIHKVKTGVYAYGRRSGE